MQTYTITAIDEATKTRISSTFSSMQEASDFSIWCKQHNIKTVVGAYISIVDTQSAIDHAMFCFNIEE